MQKQFIINDQENGKTYNERLFLNLIRDQGSMSKADLSRASKLSAQSASVIVNRLVSEGLLRSGNSIKGKIGQPSTPYSLNPNGAISIGVKVGRRSLEVVSMSFDYKIIKRIVRYYDFPKLSAIKLDILLYIEELLNFLTSKQRERVIGIGLAIPDNLSAWEETIGAPKGAMNDWAKADLATDIEKGFNIPTKTFNDANAACLAEISTSNTSQKQSFVYLYIGTFIGGGVTLEGKIFNGKNNFAGAIASLPTLANPLGVAPQLLENTSLHFLEMDLLASGLKRDCLYEIEKMTPKAMEIFNKWLKKSAPQIAFAAMSAQAFLDLDAIIIDSSLAHSLTARMIRAVQKSVNENYDQRGITDINIIHGSNGIAARAIGSGIIPFLPIFSLDF